MQHPELLGPEAIKLDLDSVNAGVNKVSRFTPGLCILHGVQGHHLWPPVCKLHARFCSVRHVPCNRTAASVLKGQLLSPVRVTGHFTLAQSRLAYASKGT
jgi:hypothetical protein